MSEFLNRHGVAVLRAAVSSAALLMLSPFAFGQSNLLLAPGFEPGDSGVPSASAGDTPTLNPGATPTATSGPWMGWNNWVAPYSAFYNQAVAHSGVQCGKSYSGPNAGIYQTAAVTPGESYTASAWFDNNSADALTASQTADVRLTFYSGPNGTGANLGLVITPAFSNAIATNIWTQESVSAAAPAGAQSVQWLAFFNNPQYGGGAMYLDDASLLDTSWNGGGASTNWSDAANWGGVVPAPYAPLVFSGTAKTANNNDLAAATPFYGIAFTSTAGAFALNGNSVNLAADVTNNSINLQTIGLNLGMQQNTNFNTAAGDLKITGSIGGAFSMIKQGSHVLTLSGSNTYIGQTVVNTGTLIVASATALPAGDDLIIAGNAAVVLNNLGAAAGFQVGVLSDSGVLDLNNNALVVHSSDLPTVTGLVQAGYNNGAWNGSSGIVSTAAAHNASHLTAVGVISNDNGSGTPLYGAGGSIATTLDGANAVDGDVLVKTTYFGDTNLDGKVDGTDYARIDAGYLADRAAPGSATGWYNGDFNYDGTVDGSDYTLIDNAFNRQGAQISAQIASQITGTSVPEPAAIGLLGIGAVGLLARRRRSVQIGR